MPAHAGGQMVDAEQVLELVRLGRAPLHAVQQRQLPVQQRLAAPGQVPEHVADAAAQPGLVDRGLDRGLLHDVERVLNLLDLVGARGVSPGSYSAGSTGCPARSWLMTAGSFSCASVSADSRSSRSWRMRPRPMISDSAIDAMVPSRPSPAARISSRNTTLA